jgi:hypothetical protein
MRPMLLHAAYLARPAKKRKLDELFTFNSITALDQWPRKPNEIQILILGAEQEPLHLYQTICNFQTYFHTWINIVY